MSNLLSPAAIIFVNNDLTDNVKAALVRQLFVDEAITGTEFDARIANDPGYPDAVHSNGLRIMVIRSFVEVTNRELADLVLFAKAGMISVLKNNYGPPNITFSIDRCYYSQIVHNIS